MPQEYINHRDIETLEDLANAIEAMTPNAHPSTIYVTCKGSPLRLELLCETLTDGSEVFNIIAREAR